MTFRAVFDDGPLRGEQRYMDGDWASLSMPVRRPESRKFENVEYTPVFTEPGGTYPSIHYTVRKQHMPNDYTPRPDAFTIMNAHLPASPRVKGDLLFGLANIVGMIEQAEANLAELKANLKKRRQARDEILTQLAELDVVVDGV